MGLSAEHPFVQLVHRQFATCDFDAVHPVQKHLVAKHRLDQEQAIWLSLLYMGYYNEGSSWVAFLRSKPWTFPGKLPVERNRRNLYPAGKLKEHFDSIAAAVKKHGTAIAWLTNGFTAEPEADWHRLVDALRAIAGNGRWAAYNTADHLHKVCGLPVHPPDVANTGSSGPADGLQRIYGDKEGAEQLRITTDVAVLNGYADKLFAELRAALGDFHVPYLEPGYIDMGMMESVLCDWSGLDRGQYYSGRNIDRMQERMHRVMTEVGAIKEMNDLWSARRAVYDERHLGEFNGWVGIDKHRLGHYARTGEVLWSHEKRWSPGTSAKRSRSSKTRRG